MSGTETSLKKYGIAVPKDYFKESARIFEVLSKYSLCNFSSRLWYDLTCFSHDSVSVSSCQFEGSVSKLYKFATYIMCHLEVVVELIIWRISTTSEFYP